jgi:hypothetical protein
MPPLRTVVTLAAALFLAVLIVWVLSVLPRTRGLELSPASRKALTAAIVLFLTAIIAWLLVIYPAYWD